MAETVRVAVTSAVKYLMERYAFGKSYREFSQRTLYSFLRVSGPCMRQSTNHFCLHLRIPDHTATYQAMTVCVALRLTLLRPMVMHSNISNDCCLG